MHGQQTEMGSGGGGPMIRALLEERSNFVSRVSEWKTIFVPLNTSTGSTLTMLKKGRKNNVVGNYYFFIACYSGLSYLEPF